MCSLAAQIDLPRSSVHRYIRLFGLQPHRCKHFKLSNEPFFIEKVRDIAGLYPHPPENALVLCVDEKSQCQALKRMQPVLPMRAGLRGRHHACPYPPRHNNLFAALDVASGEVLVQCKRRHRHQEFLASLRHIDQNVPGDLDVHLIRDNHGRSTAASHKAVSAQH